MWYSSSSTDGDRGDPGRLTTGIEITVRPHCDSMHTIQSHDHIRYVERENVYLLTCAVVVRWRIGLDMVSLSLCKQEVR